MWSFWIHHWVLLLLTGHAWFLKLKKSFQLQMATYNCTQICIPLLFSSRGTDGRGFYFLWLWHIVWEILMRWATTIHCCFYIVALCGGRLLSSNILPACMWCFVCWDPVCPYHRRGIVKTKFGPNFAFSWASRLGSLVSDLRLLPYLTFSLRLWKEIGCVYP